MKSLYTPCSETDSTTLQVPVCNDDEFNELVKKAEQLSEELRETIRKISCYDFDLTVELKKKTAEDKSGIE